MYSRSMGNRKFKQFDYKHDFNFSLLSNDEIEARGV